MVINHPLLGPRDISEFVYLGDASLLNEPIGITKNPKKTFINTYI